MNLLLLDDSDFISEEVVVLRDRRFVHLRDVLKLQPGDEVKAGAVNGAMGIGVVTRLDASEVELTVALEEDPPPPLPLTLVIALPRPKVVNRLIASVASLGVKELWLINAWRVEKSYWSSPRLTEDNFRLQSLLGLEQARDTILPEIRTARFFRRFVEEELPSLSADSNRIFAHPAASTSVSAADGHRTTLVVGPEGGFIGAEVESLERGGFLGVSLGPRILRTETAVASLIGRMF